MISPSLLRATAPALTPGRAESWAPLLTRAAAEFSIDTPERISAWVAQLAHESAGFSRLVESLSYSAPRMIVVWPSRFGHGKGATAAQKAEGRRLAASLAYKPELLAEHVYGGRNGNGPRGSGDGWKYRGRGLIMLTFLDNYRRGGAGVGLDLVAYPDLAAEPETAARLAGWFWKDKGLARYVDRGDFTGMTKALNGWVTGLADREACWRRARLALGLPARAA